MNFRRRSWRDGRLNIIIGNLLRAGVILAASIVLIGGVIFLRHHGPEIPNYRVFHSEPSNVRIFSGILRGAHSLQGRAIVQLGLLVLLATPVARVIFSVIAFALQRDGLYVAVTLIVLAVLTFSLMGGHV